MTAFLHAPRKPRRKPILPRLAMAVLIAAGVIMAARIAVDQWQHLGDVVAQAVERNAG